MQNPYVLSADPCGSSSGSAISVAASMVAVSLGTETDGSILCPSSANSVVGIKPTVGLTSRAGVVPVSPRQDTIGFVILNLTSKFCIIQNLVLWINQQRSSFLRPICRTVADAVYVLDAIAGLDYNDPATRAAAKYIPYGGYKQFLNPYGIKGKRLGIVRNPFFNFAKGSPLAQAFDYHLQTLRYYTYRTFQIIVSSLKSGIIQIVST